MENKYLAELTRRLKEDGIITEGQCDRRLPILLHGQVAMNVTQDGTALLMPSASGNQEAGELYHEVSGLPSAVKEYTSAMERAPLLQARALDPEDAAELKLSPSTVRRALRELDTVKTEKKQSVHQPRCVNTSYRSFHRFRDEPIVDTSA